MSQILEYFQQAELSLAAYASLNVGEPNQDKLKEAGMSAAQAAEFSSKWSVVDQFTDPDNGFSATLFERDGKRYLAVRGTERTDVQDILADYDLATSTGVAAKQSIALFNYVQRLKGVMGQPVGQLEWNGLHYTLNPTGAVGLLDIPLTEQITVTGHSLGGHLAMVFGRLFPQQVSQIYTYNAPGFIDSSANSFFAQIDAVLGRTGSTFSDAKTVNLYGSGLTIIAGLSDDHGTPQEILLESNTHSIVDITDSLAIYNLFATLDANLNTGPDGIAKITNFLKAATNNPAKSLESMVNAVGELFNAGSKITIIDNRDKLYERIIAIQGVLLDSNGNLKPEYQGMHVVNTSSLSAVATADTVDGYAYRYALVNLNPFAVTGNATLYSPDEWNSGNFTDQYLQDRAYLLKQLTQLNLFDASIVPVSKVARMKHSVIRDQLCC